MKTYFKPWIGPNYDKATRKILVIGDSHYCQENDCKKCGVRGDCTTEEMKECQNFTIGVVTGYMDFRAGKGEEANWMKTTFLRFDKIWYGKQDVSAEESLDFWNSVAFYNFLQTAIADNTSNSSYTSKDYAKSAPMAAEVINELRPDVIIVWGNKAFNALSDEGWSGTDDGRGYYTLPDGHIAHCIKLNHPTRAGQDEWHEILSEFMKSTK